MAQSTFAGRSWPLIGLLFSCATAVQESFDDDGTGAGGGSGGKGGGSSAGSAGKSTAGGSGGKASMAFGGTSTSGGSSGSATAGTSSGGKAGSSGSAGSSSGGKASGGSSGAGGSGAQGGSSGAAGTNSGGSGGSGSTGECAASPLRAGTPPRANARGARASGLAGSQAARPPSSHRCRDHPCFSSLASARTEGSGARAPAPSAHSFPSARFPESPSTLPRSALPSGLHPYSTAAAPVARTSEALRFRDPRPCRSPLRSVLRDFVATTTSADFSLRSRVVLSDARRDLPRSERCPPPHGRRIYVA